MAKIKYPNGTWVVSDPYPINSVFTCIGDGYPPPNVQWMDGNTNMLIGQQQQRNVPWTAIAPGTYKMICTAKNILATNTTYNTTTFTGKLDSIFQFSLLMTTLDEQSSSYDLNIIRAAEIND